MTSKDKKEDKSFENPNTSKASFIIRFISTGLKDPRIPKIRLIITKDFLIFQMYFSM